MEECTRVLPRLALRRGLVSPLAAGSRRRLELMTCTEFHEPTALLKRVKVFAAFFPSLEALAMGGGSVANITLFGYRGLVGQFDLELPSTAQTLHLRLWAQVEGKSKENDMGDLLLSLVTERMEVVVVDEAAAAASSVLLSSYRFWPWTGLSAAPPVIVREEYGATLGSHVYDCCVVLMRHLCEEHAALGSGAGGINGPVIELGCGCGLLGLWLARQFGLFVYLTDKPAQQDLVRANVELNKAWGAPSLTACLPLDWAGASGAGGHCKELAALMALLVEYESPADTPSPGPRPERGSCPGLIVAADVFYEASAVTALYATITALGGGRPGGPRVLLAQKLRGQAGGGDSASDYDCSAPSEPVPVPLGCRVLREERRVRVLELGC